MLKRKAFVLIKNGLYVKTKHHTMRFKVEQRWKETSIWQAGVQVTKFIKEGMGQGIQLHETHKCD